MTGKMMKIFLLVTACIMVLFVSAAVYAEEASAKYDEDDLVEIDDWGYMSSELIEQHTPAMTQQFIHADDADRKPEEKEAPAAEPEKEEAQEPAKGNETADEGKNPVDAADAAVTDQVNDGAENAEADDTNKAADVTETSDAADTVEAGDTAEASDTTDTTDAAETDDTNDAADTAETGDTTEAGDSAETDNADEDADTAGDAETDEDAEQDNETAEDDEDAVEDAVSKVTVKVNASIRNENLLHLKAVVDDPENNEYDYQWQVSIDGGESYVDVEDQNEDFLDVELDEENMNNLWRVKVHSV